MAQLFSQAGGAPVKMTLDLVVRGAKDASIEDESGRLVTADALCVMELYLSGNPTRTTEDGDDVHRVYEVDVAVSGSRRRGCPPAPRSFAQGGDPGEPATIEGLKVEVPACPCLSAALADKYEDIFVEALHKTAEG
jgi:hypothetical protein